MQTLRPKRVGVDEQSNGRVLRREPNLVSREVAGEVVLIPVVSDAVRLDAYLYLLDNEVAVRVWDLIDGKRSIEQIRRVIWEEFEIDEATLKTDVADFIKQLEEVGAIMKGHGK